MFNPTLPSIHKIVKETLKILQQMPQDFWRLFENFANTRYYRVKNNTFDSQVINFLDVQGKRDLFNCF